MPAKEPAPSRQNHGNQSSPNPSPAPAGIPGDGSLGGLDLYSSAKQGHAETNTRIAGQQDLIDSYIAS